MAFKLVSAALVMTALSAAAQDDAALGCVPRERIECGCTVRLAAAACSADETHSRHHLFSALTDGAPLWIVLNGKETELKSTRPASQSFSFSQGDSWTETYVGRDLSVVVSYRPGRSTCQKPPPETCEYFDVQAVVTIERSKRAPLRYDGVGSCGC